jgi:hypothetical protein
MSSTQRAYAQRNNNVTTLTPEFVTTLPDISGEEGPIGVSIAITGAPVYALTLPSVYVGGIYTVDLIDLSSGTFDASGREINIVLFTVNVPFNPAVYPGHEFTIFFKNLPEANSFSPIFTVGIIANDFLFGGPAPFPYIFSPPLPVLLTEDLTQSVTFKSDGVRMSVVSSGPAGWVGLFSLYATMLSLPLFTSP